MFINFNPSTLTSVPPGQGRKSMRRCATREKIHDQRAPAPRGGSGQTRSMGRPKNRADFTAILVNLHGISTFISRESQCSGAARFATDRHNVVTKKEQRNCDASRIAPRLPRIEETGTLIWRTSLFPAFLRFFMRNTGRAVSYN